MLHPPRHPRQRLASVVGGAALFLLTATPLVHAQPPLHDRIDQAIAEALPDFDKQAAPLADDAEFLRRVTLDLTGTIPTAADARAFFKDPSSTKRQQLIDRLLASPEHARHLAAVLDVTWLERRPDKHNLRAAWLEYLRTSCADNKPYDQLVREILSADGVDPKTRPAALFYLDRDAEPNLLTRDVSRLFLGMDFRCCQCHDHPLVDDYKQAHYYGIFAFLNRTSLFVEKDKRAVLAEKADGEVTFQSVFDKAKVTKQTGPRILNLPAIQEPAAEKGKEYVVAPANGVRSVPTFSRRALLAGALTGRDNPQFARNAVNRLWALLLGRGLVDPVDLDHSANPPSHPELLDLLTKEFAAGGFNVRGFLRELALSRTYQRSSEPPAAVKDVAPDSFAVARLKPLSPEQLAFAVMQASGLTDAERLALGKNLSEAALHARLSGNVAPFVATFGAQPGQAEGQQFQATIDQTLFLRNGALVRGWLTPRTGNLIDRLSRLQEPAAVAEELYLSVLTRLPSADEGREVGDYLKTRTADRTAALGELAWALVASAEFRFNH
jgi:hypothetical protein